jgi:hypothetical protein
MASERKTGVVGKTAATGGSLALSFATRWLFWTVLIGTPGYFVGEMLWPHAYKLWGPPLQMFQQETYQAVLFGDLVSSVMGGAAVAFVGTFRRK